MTARLALTVPFHPSEIPTSYVSRLAARNCRMRMVDFANDVGLELGAIARGDDQAIGFLCSLAGLPRETFRMTKISTPSTMRYRVGNESLQNYTLLRGEVRLCPACVARDLGTGGGVWHAVHRLHWQLLHVGVCVEHGLPLLRFNAKLELGSAYDFTAIVRRNSQWILEASRGEPKPPTSLETYLSARIYGRHETCWANRLEIPALCKAAEYLGALIAHGNSTKFKTLDASEQRIVTALGFDVLAQGPDALRNALDQARPTSSGPGGQQPHPQFGEFQQLLGTHWKKRSDLDPVRDVVRDYLIDNFPFPAGAEIFGHTLTARRLHTLRSASAAIGRRRAGLEEALIERNIAMRDPDGKLVLSGKLSIDLVEGIRRDIDNLINEKEAAEKLGISTRTFRILVEAKIVRLLKPARKHAERTFSYTDLEHFLETVARGANVLSRQGSNFETLTRATVRANCSLSEILSAIIDGRLSACGKLPGDLRLDRILVHIPAVKAALPALHQVGNARIPTLRWLRITNSTLNFLLKEGLLHAVQARNPTSRLMGEMVTIQSIQEFCAKYISLGTLAASVEPRIVPGVLYARLKRRGINPCVDQKNISKIYRRSELPVEFVGVGTNHPNGNRISY